LPGPPRFRGHRRLQQHLPRPAQPSRRVGHRCQDVEDDCPHPQVGGNSPAPCAPQALSFPSSDAASPVCRASPATWPHGSCGRSGRHPEEWFVEQARANGCGATHVRSPSRIGRHRVGCWSSTPHLRPLADTFVSQMLARCDSTRGDRAGVPAGREGPVQRKARRVWRAWSSWPDSGHVCCRLPEIVRKGIEDGWWLRTCSSGKWTASMVWSS